MSTLKPEPLTYTVWFLFDRKVPAGFLLLTAFVISVFVGFKAESVLWSFAAFAVFILSLLPLFFPVNYELNADGVFFGTFFRKHQIRWDEIYRYELRPDGVMLFSQREHFVLDVFCGLYLPVPEKFMPETIYFLRFFIDKLPE